MAPGVGHHGTLFLRARDFNVSIYHSLATLTHFPQGLQVFVYFFFFCIWYRSDVDKIYTMRGSSPLECS